MLNVLFDFALCFVLFCFFLVVVFDLFLIALILDKPGLD